MMHSLRDVKETETSRTFLEALKEVVDREPLQTVAIPTLVALAAGYQFALRTPQDPVTAAAKTVLFATGLTAMAIITRAGDHFDDVWHRTRPERAISGASIAARTVLDGVVGAAAAVAYEWGMNGKEILGTAAVAAGTLIAVRLVHSAKARSAPIDAHPV